MPSISGDFPGFRFLIARSISSSLIGSIFNFPFSFFHTRILQYNDQVAETNEDILALWQKYFQDLSNPDFKQDFDYEKYDLSHIENAIIEKNEKGKLILSVVHMPVFALSLRVFLLPSVVTLEGSLFPLVFLHFSTGYI
jgi:hypothetical protein